MSPEQSLISDASLSRRTVLKAGLGFAAGLGLAACGASASGKVQSSTAATATETPEGDISFLTPIFNGSDGKALLEKLLAQLKTKYPKMSVSVDYTDYSHLNDKITTSLAGGKPYDVMMLGVGWVPPFAAKGVLANLNTTVDALSSTYNKRILDGCTYNGGVYALPVMLDTRFGIYRKDIFDAAGISAPPKNFDEMRSMAKELTQRDSSGKLTRAGIDVLSLDLRQVWLPLLWANGGDLFNADLSKPTFNSDEGVAALQFMTDLIRTDKSEDYGFTKSGDVSIPLLQGRAAMMVGHNNMWLNVKQSAPELISGGKLGTFLIANTRAAMFQGGTLACMSAKTPHVAAAKVLVDFLATPDVSLQASAQRGNVPSATSALSSDYVKNDAFVQFALSNFDHAFSEGGVPAWLDIRNDFKASIESSLTGKQSPKQVLDDLAAKAAQAMAKKS